MATLGEIAEAIESIKEKKQNLQKSFEDLQKHSNSLSSFNLSWPQIDTHFSQIQSSLQSRFSLLQQSLPNSDHNPENPFPLNPEFLEKIKEMCQKMEGPKLRGWVKKNRKNPVGFINELGMGLKWAPDPYKLVLDGIERISPKGETNGMLLEGLMRVEGVELREEVRERAKNLGIKWKERVFRHLKKFPLMVVGLLRLMCCYKLVGEFSKDDVFELVFSVASNPKATEICRALGFEEHVPDLVRKLISYRRQHLAIKFVHEFKLEGKFPPAKLEYRHPQSFSEQQFKKLEERAKRDSARRIKRFNRKMSKQKPHEHHLQTKGTPPAAHVNHLAAGFPSSMGCLGPSQQNYLQPTNSHQYALGSQLPFSSYITPPVATFGFPPPHHPLSHA